MGVLTLAMQHELELRPKPPFNFDATVYKPSHFPSSDKHYEEGTFWQTIVFGGRVLGIRLVDGGNVENPLVVVNVYAEDSLNPRELELLKGETAYRFDMPTDISPFLDEFQNDEVLGPAVRRWRGMRVSAAQSLYEFIVVALVLQNATVRRSVQMLENLFAKYGGKDRFDGKTLSHYWRPENLAGEPEEALRALKLGYRARFIQRISATFAEGDMDEMELRMLPTEELKARLLRLYGIGPASVWYILFEVFHRYDAFEHISLWEQKIYSRLLFGRELVSAEAVLREVDHRWGQWKMLAAHYIFEDLFWQRRTQKIEWLEKLIRL